MGILGRPLSRILPWLPRPVIARVARRYVVESREEVLSVVGALHRQDRQTTIDILGENVTEPDEALKVTQEYLDLLDVLARRGLPSHISVKPTHVGLRLDEDLACENLARLVDRAAEIGTFVRIDMEDSSTTDASLRIFRSLRESRTAVGLAIQAHLRRSRQDVESLLPLNPSLRICKGIYPEALSVAYKDRQEIRENFHFLVRSILEGGGFVALATHDRWLVDRGLKLLEEMGSGENRHEFQMLLGVGGELRPRILATGSRLRIYCPFGAEWYEYSLRRLRENPDIAGYILKDLIRGLLPWGKARGGRDGRGDKAHTGSRESAGEK